MALSDPVSAWRKSSVSENTNCVEVCLRDDRVLVRDSKCPDELLLVIGAPGWQHFLWVIQSDRKDFYSE
ncbi:DUF397 domain-containing protein [Streptomyces europaeiscabiei]|uniref:DUF397 domain-containing protein n=1 Tax=Streptomyces europaeiscabiei TaxID=146819 RepID=UPI0038F6AA1C